MWTNIEIRASAAERRFCFWAQWVVCVCCLGIVLQVGMKHTHLPPEWHSCFHPNPVFYRVCCFYQHLLKLMQSTLSSWTLAVSQTSSPLLSPAELNQSKSDRSIYSWNGAIVCWCQWNHTVRLTWKMPFIDTQMCCQATACAAVIMQRAGFRRQETSLTKDPGEWETVLSHTTCSMWGGIKSSVIRLLFPVPTADGNVMSALFQNKSTASLSFAAAANNEYFFIKNGVKLESNI